MTLIKYKEPTKYSFYKWIKKYPDSKYWTERVKKHPELRLSPLIDAQEFYKFVKTACKNGASSWLKWDKVEKIILEEISFLKKKDLKELKNIFERLIIFYKTSAIKQGFDVENLNRAKDGNFIERGIKNKKFYEKELPINKPQGGVLVYDKKTKKYKILNN